MDEKPLLLPCPACRKKVSSSAEVCIECGQRLTDEWEQSSRARLERNQIVGAFVVIIIAGWITLSALFGGSGKPSPDPASVVQAFGFKNTSGRRGLFVDVRDKKLELGEKEVRVLCPADGTGEIVAAFDDNYVAVNGAARGWATGREFWFIQGQKLIPVSDSGFPNNVPPKFALIEPHMNTIIKAGIEMCPSDNFYARLVAAIGDYEKNARRLGIYLP